MKLFLKATPVCFHHLPSISLIFVFKIILTFFSMKIWQVRFCVGSDCRVSTIFLFLEAARLRGSASAFFKYWMLVEAVSCDGKRDGWDRRAGIPACWRLAGNSDSSVLQDPDTNPARRSNRGTRLTYLWALHRRCLMVELIKSRFLSINMQV